MNRSRLAASLGAAVIAVAIGLGVSQHLGAAGQPTGDAEVRKRIEALEAGQQAILKELLEIKALLQARPQPPVAEPAPTAGAPGTLPKIVVPPNPTAPPNFDLNLAGAPMKGRADAKLVILEFSDFQCPFCGRYTRETLPQIERDYVETGKAKYSFRHFPLERVHPQALRAAEAADCAHAQGRFWEMHTRLFANPQALSEPALTATAQSVGLNMGTFNQCFANQLTSPTRIRQDQAEGSRAGITGTPAFFLGTMTREGKLHPLRRLVGAKTYAAFKTVIDNLLASPELTR